MSDEESTPRLTRRGRPPVASASKAPEKKESGTPRGRGAKPVAETSKTERKTRRGNEQGESSAVVLESDQEEPTPTPRGRAAKKQPEKPATTSKKDKKIEEEKVVAPVFEKSDSEEIEIVKTVKPRRGKAVEMKVKQEEKEEEVKDSDDSSDSGDDSEEEEEEEAPAPSKSVPRKPDVRAKQKERAAAAAAAAASSSKPTRGRRAAGGGDRAETAAREEEEWENKKTRPAAARGGRRGRKVVESEDEEEEEVVEVETRPSARSTRKGRKPVESEDEEEEEVEVETRPSARDTRKDKKKVAELDDEEEEEEERPTARSTRKGKKGVDREEEEKATRRASHSARRGRKAVESDEEEEEERESPKKKARMDKKTVEKDKDKAATQSRANRRIDFKDGGESSRQASRDDEKKKKEKEKKKDVRPVETVKKQKNRRDESIRSDDEARGEPDIEIDSDAPMSAVYDDEEEDDVKPFFKLDRYNPSFVNDLPSGSSSRSEDSSDESEEESDASVKSVEVLSSTGMKAASAAKSKDVKKASEAICVNIREALRGTFENKDNRSFDHAVNMLSKTKELAYKRKNYAETARCFYDEIENQLTNMMVKMEKEKEPKAEVEGKQRVLRAIAKFFADEFVRADPEDHDQHWPQVDYLLNQYATADDAHIRAFFCYWVGAMLKYSKECHHTRYGKLSRQELEREHERRREDASDDDEIDEDRRLIDGHVYTMPVRRVLYGALYTSLKHEDIDIRIAAIRAFAIVQDDPIPPNHIEAVKHSPKDMIMKQLLDIHVAVRRAAIEELRPSTDQQIEVLIYAARNEKHEKERIMAFTKLGRLPLVRFNLEQRHMLLAMITDNRMGPTIENWVLQPWLAEMVTGENPNPIYPPAVNGDAKGARKKRAGNENLTEKWAVAPLLLLRYLDCVNYSEDVLHILRKASAIARTKSELNHNSISTFIGTVIDECGKEEMGMITMSDYKHLLDRDVSDEARALMVTFWLHSLQFIHEKAKNEAEQMDAVLQLSPSMKDLRALMMDLLEDERERMAPRKGMIDKGEVDPTHPAFIRTSDKLLSIVTNFMSAFRYLTHTHGDTDAMREWRNLLIDLTTGHHIDLSPALWEVIMHDLLEFHSKNDEQRDDLIYEVAVGMGFNFDDAIRDGKGEGRRGREKGGAKSPRKTSPAKAARTHTKRTIMANDDPATPVSSTEDVKKLEEEERKREEKKFIYGHPPCLGMVHGALKTAHFKGTTAESFAIVVRSELDSFRSISDAKVRAACLECIGMLGLYSEEVAERYIGMVMESLIKVTPESIQGEMEQMEMNSIRDEEETKTKRRRKMKEINPDELERDYDRRAKEDRVRREAERRRRRGGKDNCRGLALAVISDLIVAHSITKVEIWMGKCEEKYSLLALYTFFESLSQESDFELVFKVLHCTCKLALHDKDIMQVLNKTMAQLQFRAFHPSSFTHSLFRSCALAFTPLFGSRSVANQMALTEVVITMLSMLKDTAIEYRNLIDRGDNAARAIAHVVWSCAPSSLKLPANGVRQQNTAHGVLLRKLGQNLESCGEDARNDIPIDMEYYKALLDAVDGIEYSGQTANGLRSIYDVLFNNMDLVAQWDKAGEARKKSQRLVKKLDVPLDCVNKIIQLNKALGNTLTDQEVRLPFEDEEEKIIDELKKKVAAAGVDVNAMSPIKDGRASSSRLSGSAIKGTPATAKRRPNAKGVDSEVRTGLLKKEPARSKSYAATAAAERKEAAAASSSSTSQMTPRSSTRDHPTRKRVARLATIVDESDSD